MKVRAGIVGPQDSVNLMCDIAKEFDNFISVPFVYQRVEDTVKIVQKNRHTVDFWVFSGMTPYTVASQAFSEPFFFYPQLNGSSLTQVLVEIAYKDRRNLERVSIDSLNKRILHETYQDLCISDEEIYLYEYPGYVPIDEIVTFHHDLFKDNKVDTCVTCLRSVYERLQSQGIPVYRITPTRANIRHTFKTAYQLWETQHFKQSQIAVILIQTGNMVNATDHPTLSYDLHRLNLELQSPILAYAESISGSFVSLGTGKFCIFSTRGSLQQGQHSVSLLEKLSLITDLPSNIGIGYGETSLTAEENARLALHHAQNYGHFCAFLVNDNEAIEGPLQEKLSISYDYSIDNKEISEKLKQAGVTITTYNKLLSVQKAQSNHAITTADVAKWLKMTPRNASRILAGLAEQGLAEIIGEEAPVSRGRPRKLYRIRIDRE